MISHNQRLTTRGFVAGLTIAGLAVLGVVAFPMSASAATYSVTSPADAGAGSLRDAIATANASAGADTITFALPSNSVIELLSTVTITDALTIDGSGVPGLDITGRGGLGTYALLVAAPAIPDQDFSFNDLIFDGTAGSVPGWQGVAIDTSFGTLNNLARSLALMRITGKNIDSAGLQGPVLRDFAMQSGGPVTITDSTFTNNTSTAGALNGGGAVFIRGTNGPVTVTGSTFTNNSARSGGAIFFEGNGGGVATLSVVGSTFTGNTANGAASVPASDGEGGAIAANLIGGVTITGSTFSGNTASLDGGAIAIGSLQSASSQVSIATSSFLGNHATFGGGGFWTSTTQGDVSVSGSTFAGNTLSSDPADGALGNSIRLTGTGNHGLTVLSSTLDEAAAAFSTWAIAIETTGTSPVNITHSTIVGPGALTIRTLVGTSSVISHTILWSLGTADNALVALLYGLPGANTIAASWNLSSGTAQPFLAVGSGNQFSVSSFGLSALANNGGPTLTRLPAGSSPAHNTGDPAISGAPATDQRGSGFIRIVQTVDIGAVEIQTPTLAATGITVAPGLPLTGAVLILLGLFAVAYSRGRRTRTERA
jgi:predicted outer membrane repeat protein